jgi:hypothetical protein
MISKECINKLRNIITQDSQFLCESELMDYSLFLIKLTLNKREAEGIFGSDIQKNQNKAIKSLLLNSPGDEDNSNNIGKEENNANEGNNEILQIDETKNSVAQRFKDIQYYHPYLFPSLNQGVGYIISIIDYFQYFNFFKIMEAGIISKFKTGLKKEDNNTISCVDPKTYSERFIKYVNQLTDVSEIIVVNDGRYQDEMEEKGENETKPPEESEENDENEKLDIYGDNLNDDELNINLKDHFNLRITIMNKNLLPSKSLLFNRKTFNNMKRNNSKLGIKDNE